MCSRHQPEEGADSGHYPEEDMHWHLDSRGQPCGCIEEEHDALPQIPYHTALELDNRGE